LGQIRVWELTDEKYEAFPGALRIFLEKISWGQL
jgi:hypothetical protein